MTSSGGTAVRERWAAVGDRLESLGLKLDLHYRQESSRTDQPVDDGLVRIGTAISDAFDALGEAVADPAVRADVRQTGQLLVDAVNSTLERVGDTIRRRSADT